MKRKNKNRKFIVIGLTYLFILLTISSAYSFFNEDLSINAKSKIIVDEEDSYEIEHIPNGNGCYEGKCYYQYNSTLTYTGKKTVIGWEVYIKVPYDTEVIGCYSASECVVSGEVLTIKNTDYNGRLTNGDSATYGIRFSSQTENYEIETLGAKFTYEGQIVDPGPIIPVDPIDPDPENPENPNPENPSDIIFVDYISTEFSVIANWGSAAQCSIKVANNSSSVTLLRWEAVIALPEGIELQNAWGCSYQYDEVTHTITLSGPAWAPSLGPMQSTDNPTMQLNIKSGSLDQIVYKSFAAITSTGETVAAQIGG